MTSHELLVAMVRAWRDANPRAAEAGAIGRGGFVNARGKHRGAHATLRFATGEQFTLMALKDDEPWE